MAQIQAEGGDEYIRSTAQWIRTNEASLAQVGRRTRRNTAPPSTGMLSWLGLGSNVSPPPMTLTLDIYHLFYLLMRLEGLGMPVGSLDVHVDAPAKPMTFVDVYSHRRDKSDAMSIAESIRSSLSAVSALSLGGGWWSRTQQTPIETELKYIYSSFTKLPALSLAAPGPRVITELASEPPNENALPLYSFKSIQILECTDIDPRGLLGWDQLAESLRSLTMKRTGLNDFTDIFIRAVIDDGERRAGTMPTDASRHIRLPSPVPEEDESEATSQDQTPQLPPLKWAFLTHLSLADNALTSIPSALPAALPALTSLDLSSNLLVTVPSGLAGLISLSLQDNMIESVLGISTRLGAIRFLSLAHNRLHSLCGLERLLALTRIDLRSNEIDDPAEVGRLATLPLIEDVRIQGNPLTDDDGHRTECFTFFWKEGKHEVTLDGTGPSYFEKRFENPAPVAAPVPHISPTATPPVVAVSHHHTHHSDKSRSPADLSPAGGVVAKKRRMKRIVDLDSDGASRHHLGHSRSFSERSARMASPTRATAERRKHGKDLTAGRSQPIESIKEPQPVSTVTRPADLRPRHSRHYTEHVPTTSVSPPTDTVSPLASPSFQRSMTSSSSDLTRSKKRASRVSASVFEPGNSPDSQEGGGGASIDPAKEAEAFRARIEALRADMGDGWLKVLSQTQQQTGAAASR